MSVTEFIVREVPRKQISAFIEKHHYSHNINGVHSLHCFALLKENKFGLYDMIGAMIYGNPGMPAIASKYNPDNPLRCWELRRLVCIDDTPKNTESYFIGQTFKWLKKNTDCEVIVSFADRHYGHEGIIYQATNFHRAGVTAAGKVLMVDGRQYHSRTLNQDKRPYGRAIKARYDAGDPNIFWETRVSKNIYIYYLDKRVKRKYLKTLGESDTEVKDINLEEEDTK
jgi:hypothetical protein